MESAPSPLPADVDVDLAVLAAAAERAAEVAADGSEPSAAITAATEAFHHALPWLLPSVFVLEHSRLWLVAQRGYAVVPDGLCVETGIMGRAVRLGSPQLVTDVRGDADYVPALPGVCSELAIPLRVDAVVGVLNVESERVLPSATPHALRPLADALTPLAAELGSSRKLDLGALARLFVYLGSLREADEIAALATASIAKVLSLEASQLVTWDELGAPRVEATWRDERTTTPPLTVEEVVAVRALVDSSVVCQLLDTRRELAVESGRASVVWLPLRANGEELGALVGVRATAIEGDPAQLDTAALLAAHVAASLEGAVVLERERRSAATDPLTGILNRRGLEECLERVIAAAQDARVPVSVLVIDCDNFKEINDRAGHGFGDSLLVETARVLENVLPEGAEAARLGGDEFVVVLPKAGVDVAQGVGDAVRTALRQGLTDAGFPLRISGGIATYPFDGANGSMLVRAADQALYAAKNGGKDQIASFGEVVGRERPSSSIEEVTAPAAADRRGRTGRSDASVLAEAIEASAALEQETTVEGVCSRLCKALVFVVGATGCTASRVVGDLLVDATTHALREVSLGEGAAYRIDDFPQTARILESGTPLAISFLDGSVDPAEAFLLRELEMNAVLMLPLRVRGSAWGLVELYDMRLRRFSEDDVAVATFLVGQAERRLEAIEPDEAPQQPRPVYELPPEGSARRPRTR